VIHLVDGWDGRRAAVEAKRELEQRDGVEPYVIPMGGTNALGAVGYVNAALEVIGQMPEDELPDAVYVAGGTLGTAVGLAVGFAAAQARTRVVAVRVTPDEVASDEFAAKLVSETVALLHSLDAGFPLLAREDVQLTLRHDWFDPGYGVPTPETTHAVELLGSEGLKVETTYTGKALAAMLSDGDHGELSGQHVMFWDTYNSAPYPAPGADDSLPPALREYVAECDRIFGVHE
jgi:D-cysteine desulfhydrase